MAKTTKGKVVLSAEAPTELRDRLDERAETENRSRSEVIVRACLFFLEYAEVERANGVPKLKNRKKT
jgi:predicted transcriptional regulator